MPPGSFPSEADLDAFRAVLHGPSDPEIVILEASLRIAQLTADVGALECLISDDLLFAGPDGHLASEAEDLAAHRCGVIRFRGHEPQELRIRRVGSTVAVCSLSTKLSVEVGGKLVSGLYRYTRVWAKEQGAPWQVVAGQVSEIPS